MSTVVDLYTVQILYDGSPLHYSRDFTEIMAETEENLTDLLPPGYRARIRRWNQPDNEGNDDE